MKVTMDDLIEHKGEFYFVPIECAFLCKIGLDKKIEIIDRIPGEYLFKKDLFSKILLYDDTLYLVPKNEDKLYSYNLTLKEWKSYGLLWDGLKYKFMEALIWENKLVMIGCCVPYIVVFDLTHKTIECKDMPYMPYKKLFDFKNDAYYRRGYYLKDDSIYLASAVTNEVCEFNLNDDTIKRFEVGDSSNTYNGLFYDGKCFWLSPRNNSYIVKWDGNKNYQNQAIPSDEKALNCLYLEPVSIGSLIMLPAYEANGTIYLKDDGTIEEIERKQYSVVKYVGDKTVLVTKDGFIEIISSNETNVIELSFDRNNKYLDYYSNNDFEIMKKSVENEKEIFMLKDFMECIEKYG